MQANIDPTVTIDESDRYCYHLRMEKIAVDPRDPLHPIVRKLIRVFRPIDYKKYFQCPIAEQIEFLKTMNFQNAELVHDPTKEEVVKIERVVSPEEEHRDARKIAEVLKTPGSRTKKAVKK